MKRKDWQESLVAWKRTLAGILAGLTLLALGGAMAGCGGMGGAENSGFSSERLPDPGLKLLPSSNSSAGSNSTPSAAPVETATIDEQGRSTSCPQVVSWPNEKFKTVYQGGQTGDANAVVYRAELTKLSRECRVSGGRVYVKYGFAGRVLLGPKGYAGSFSIPVSVKATDAYKAQVGRDRMSVRVTVPGNQTVGYFSMVRQMSLPVRTGTRLQDYKIFVALK